MRQTRRSLAILALAVALAVAGCGGFVGTSPGAESETAVTPVPVPTTATPAGPSADYEYWGGISAPENDSERQRRYFSLRPTCERPPGLVIHIQVAALQYDDPATHAGINTTWQFASPSNRAQFPSYEAFVALVTDEFRPLLDARTVTYGPVDVDRDRDTARREVTVGTANGTSASYTWIVERQRQPPYEGCWMTTGVLSDT